MSDDPRAPRIQVISIEFRNVAHECNQRRGMKRFFYLVGVGGAGDFTGLAARAHDSDENDSSMKICCIVDRAVKHHSRAAFQDLQESKCEPSMGKTG